MRFNEVVHTTYGKIRGFPDESETIGWKGVPFAKPPTGDLRWKAPRDPEPWDSVFEAKEFCIHCPQLLIGDAEFSGDENCLYLNIWRPDTAEEKLPVYFWVHGGGNAWAVPLVSKLPGARLARFSNVVVVSINYRLGEFGWFTHPALRSGKPGEEYDDSGNYGTLDIIKSLEWVRQNIESFGGNPNNVCAAGASAGAFNILTLLISPLAKNLFHKAILQSGRWDTHIMEEGDVMANRIISQLLVNDKIARCQAEAESLIVGMSLDEIAAYLRSKTISEFASCRPKGSFSPHPAGFQDGYVIPAEGFKTLDNGTHPNKVPLIVGMNKEEVKLFLAFSLCDADEETYQAAAAFASDLKKAVNCDNLLRRLRDTPDQPDVYGYQFCWGARNGRGISPIPDPYALQIGAAHGVDIPFFWNVESSLGLLQKLLFTKANLPGREALTHSMMTYVAQFAHTGNPNIPGSKNTSIKWEPWSNDAGGAKCILFDVEGEVAKIEMSTTEMIESEVWLRLNSSEKPLMQNIKKPLSLLGLVIE